MVETYELNNKNENVKIGQFKRITFVIITILTLIQQMPVIRDLFYMQFRITLYIIFGVFCVMALFSIKHMIKYNLVKFFLFAIAYSLLLTLATGFSGNTLNTLTQLIIPFGILICSLNTDFTREQLSKLLLWYVLLVVILGISSIYYYGQGFIITETYLIPGKNQIGPMLGIASILTAIWILSKKQFKLRYNYLIFNFILFLILISSILVIRNRASLVAIFVILVLFILLEYKFKMTIKNLLFAQITLTLTVLLFLFGLFDGVFDAFWKSMTLNYDTTDFQSLSAGRTDVYQLALHFALQYPILGEIGAVESFYFTPHNYILYNWVKYGFILSIPLITFYLYLWFFTIKGIIFNKFKRANNKFTVPLWVLLFSLVVSIFEYTYPYGPGVSQLMVWFLIGQYLKEELHSVQKN